MEIIRVAPIHDRIHQNRLSALLNTHVSKDTPEGLFVCTIDIDLASLVYPANSESPATKGLFPPATIENIGALLRSNRLTACRLLACRLLEKFIDSTLEASQSDIITLGLVTITMCRRRLLPHGGAEIKGDHEKKNKNPQHNQQSDTPLVKTTW